MAKDFHLILLVLLFNFNSLVLFPPSLCLAPQFFIVLGGVAVGCSALIPLLPLFDFELMYTTLKLAKTGSIISATLNPVSLDICARWQNM